jgi:c-di-GMP-binding flagellar brake protein YcgR
MPGPSARSIPPIPLTEEEPPPQPAPEAAEEERRQQFRHPIMVKKIFAAELFPETPNPVHCFVRIQDLSEGGMRIHSDVALPLDEPIPLKLYLDEPTELTVKVVWHRQLYGGMNIFGLQFLVVSPADRDKIDRFIDAYSWEKRRESYRLNRILVVEMEDEEQETRLPVFTLNLSATGMCVLHSSPVFREGEVPFRILTSPGAQPIHVRGRVVWQKENEVGRVMMGVQFTALDPENRRRIESFLDEAMSEDLRADPFATTRKAESVVP